MKKTVVPGLLIVIGILVGATCFRSCPSGQDTAHFKATWEYWAALKDVYEDANAIYNKSETADFSTPAAVQTVTTDRARELRQYAQEVAGLPVVDVDAEVIAYSQKVSIFWREFASVLEEIGSWFVEIEQYTEETYSFGAGVEAFLRGLMGDPWGKYNEQKTRAQVLEEKQQRWSRRLEEINATAEQLTNEENALRVRLSQRYEKEFPQL